MNKDPYLKVVDRPRAVKEPGPQSTVFGVLGHTRESGMTRMLNGLVISTTPGAASKEKKEVEKVDKHMNNSERKILGAASKTRIPGAHMGQVPYAGMYMSHMGKEVS